MVAGREDWWHCSAAVVQASEQRGFSRRSVFGRSAAFIFARFSAIRRSKCYSPSARTRLNHDLRIRDWPGAGRRARSQLKCDHGSYFNRDLRVQGSRLLAAPTTTWAPSPTASKPTTFNILYPGPNRNFHHPTPPASPPPDPPAKSHPQQAVSPASQAPAPFQRHSENHAHSHRSPHSSTSRRDDAENQRQKAVE